MNTDTINLFKNCFKQISVSELNKRIDHYRQVVNLKTISEERLKEELQKLFQVEINGNESSFFSQI